MKKYYFDCSATTPVRPEVIAEMEPYFSKFFGNASSLHSFGRQTRQSVEKARGKIAEILSTEPEEICFTSGGTESDNFAIKGIAYANNQKRKHIITSQIEHPAVLNCCRHLETRGYKITYLPVDKYGLVSLKELKGNIGPDTILVSIMLANNETGTIQPMEEIGTICSENEITLHTDAVQAIGKIPINVKNMKVSLLSISGHKIYGPKGIGALYIKKGTRITPLLHGGHHEHNKRAGTENVAGIVGLARAMELAMNEINNFTLKMKSLRDKLEKNLLAKIKNIEINGHPEKRLPNLSNISFKYVEGESILLNLDMYGIAASTGSACASGSLEASHVLKAMGIAPSIIHGTLRFSLGRMNTEKDIDFLIAKLIPVIKRLRKISPLRPSAKARGFLADNYKEG